MSDYLIPFLILALLLYSHFKKVEVYDSFANGAKKGLELVFTIFPYILAILFAVELFRVSGLLNLFVHWFSPVFTFLGMPIEIIELVFLRPFTGSGSLAILNDIILKHGADSYISRCACVIMGSTETIFYVTSIYFSKTSVKKLGWAIPISLFASLIGAIVSCLICRVI